jgi:hypothetical protein
MEHALSIKKKFQQIVRFLTESHDGHQPPTGISVTEQFKPDQGDEISIARNLNASFIMLLSDQSIPGLDDAHRYCDTVKGSQWDMACGFLSAGIGLVFREIEEQYKQDERFRGHFNDLYDCIALSDHTIAPPGIIDRIWRVFFPEGVIDGDLPGRIASLREKRTVRITALNDDPVRAPEREVLFTMNALVTVPSSGKDFDRLAPETRNAVENSSVEEQIYWYDHPIPIGAAPGDNEFLYCLRNFSEALRFEEAVAGKDPARNIDCIVSVSVTHRGLRSVVRPWLQSELVKAEEMRGINLYVVTEEDTERMLDDIILPAVLRYIGDCDVLPLRGVFGVDGDYGRHYSFLKAIALFWRVFISPEIKGTFKIDLDQVFPQEELVSKTGTTAFGHLRTPLWGARGADSLGNSVYLGMIAGALVNRRDIEASLFTPDVPFPEKRPEGDEVIFWSAVPQALSTAAEMAAGREQGGAAPVIQRVHVTGGTTGILVEALTRYRPFTPACIGRAEDQAYLLSVLLRPDERGYLRYVHKPGLIMRHDADLFADAAEAARTGKTLGDYVRTMLFSDYARALPWTVDRIKDAVDPFTGCFISRIPITIVFLRFALKTARLFASNKPEDGLQFFNEGIKRLSGMMEQHNSAKNPLSGLYEMEKRGWDLYYDVMDIVEKKISSGDPFAKELADKARKLIDSLKIKCPNNPTLASTTV